MQEPYPDPAWFINLRRIKQISEHHCGPAVVQMLLENLGVKATQREITRAAGAERTIARNGTRVDQLAKAVQVLAPGARLWFKEYASLEDLIYVLEECKFPVGVEWQGLFEDDTGNDEDDDYDYGHYSIIAHIDQPRGELIIMDPYKDFADRNRIIKISTFLRRWWDYNEIRDPKTRRKTYKKDEQLFFLIAPLEVSFPEELGMKSFQ
jgi:hypothetical protein